MSVTAELVAFALLPVTPPKGMLYCALVHVAVVAEAETYTDPELVGLVAPLVFMVPAE